MQEKNAAKSFWNQQENIGSFFMKQNGQLAVPWQMVGEQNIKILLLVISQIFILKVSN